MTTPERILRELIHDAAKEQPPELDWSRIEHRVFAQLDSDLQTRRIEPSYRPPWGRVAAIGAVAAALALLIMSATRGASMPPSVAETTSWTAASEMPGVHSIDARRLHEGQGLSADTHALTVEHAGWASFTLQPGSRAVMRNLGHKVLVDLAQGRIDVRIVPQAEPDRFVVRVDGAQAAAHGTVFSVERADGEMLVTVDTGSVAVGPASKSGATHGWILVAPAQGSFSTQGPPRATFLPPPSAQPEASPSPEALPAPVPAPVPVPVPVPVPAPVPESPAVKPAQPPPSAPPLPDRLTPEAARPVHARITSAVEHCYRNNAPAFGPELRVVVRTQIRIQVAANGTVDLALFDPPLARDAQICASAAALRARYPAAKNPSTFTLALEF